MSRNGASSPSDGGRDELAAREAEHVAVPRIATRHPGVVEPRDPPDDRQEVHHHPEDAGPGVVDPQLAAHEAVDEAVERGLHRIGQLLVGGELRVERDVAEAAGDDPPVLGLVPVVVAVATVVRDLEEALGNGLCRDHLSTRRDDQPLDRPEQAARVPVGADDDGGAAELVERRRRASCSRISTPASAASAASRRTQRAGWRTPSGTWRSAAVKRPASGGSKWSIHSAAKPAADEGLVLGAQLVPLLVVDRDPQRADAPERVAGERLDRVDRALGPGHQLAGARLADRLGRDVERGRHAAEREASVAAARALGDPAARRRDARACPPAASRSAAAQPVTPPPTTTTSGSSTRCLRERRRRLAEPVGRHRGILRERRPRGIRRTRIDESRTMPPLTMTHTAQPERGIPREAVAAAGVAAALAAALAWLGPPGQRFRGAPLPERRVRGPRLRDLEQLLVRRPLQLRHLQPPLLPARGPVRDQAARGRKHRHGGARVRRHRMRANGGLRHAGRTAPSPSSGPGSSSPAPSRSRSAPRSRCSRCGRCRPGVAGALRSSRCSRSRRAPSPSFSSP